MMDLAQRASLAASALTPCRVCDRPCLRAGLEPDRRCTECARQPGRHLFAVGRRKGDEVVVCSWCHPGSPEEDGVSHGICHTHEAELLAKLDGHEEARHSDRLTVTGSRRGGREARNPSALKIATEA